MLWSVFKVTAVIALIMLPILYFYRKERVLKEVQPAPEAEGQGVNGAWVGNVLKVSFVLFLLMLPVFYLSDASYSFFSHDVSAVKLAFKHSGKRVVDCDEAALIKREAEKYRELLRDTQGVKMNIEGISKCPRERHPVRVELYIDGKKVLDRDYMPTGIKRDMASYIYENIMVAPGVHSISARMNDSGPGTTSFHTLEEIVDIKRGSILLLRFDDKKMGFVME